MSEPESQLEKELQQEAAAEAGAADTAQVEVSVKITPPPKFVRSVRELIYWEYAKLIAKAAHFDGNFRFTTSRFNLLKSGKLKMSDIEQDDQKQFLREPKCEYCGSKEPPFTKDHIIPLVRGGPDNSNNIVVACKSCNSSKGEHDIFEWYYVVRGEKEIPKLVWSKYLKLVYNFHIAHGTIDKVDLNGDGELNILDLGAIFKRYEEKR